jgi:deoxyribose-phosphate aldolase
VNKLNQYLEQSVLRPDTTLADVRRVCEEALQHQLAGVCIPPLFVRDARRILGEDSIVRLSTVVAFPMGYSALASKSEEIKRAIDEGADEIDGVINLAALKSGNWNHVEHDIEGMALATNMRGKALKVILEMGLLQSEDVQRLVAISIAAKVKFLKTGTGFHGHPATVEQVRLLHKLANGAIKIKASGGIRTAAAAQQLVDAGADRLGTSDALAILA